MNSVFLTSDIRVIEVHSPLTITKTISVKIIRSGLSFFLFSYFYFYFPFDFFSFFSIFRTLGLGLE